MEYLVLSLVLIAFLLASYEDIKKKEIYNYLNYSLAFFIVVIALIHTFFTNSFDPVKYVGFGLLFGFALGTLLYYAGIWGGGDAKFLIGFSAASFYLIPFTTPIMPEYIQETAIYLLTQGTTYLVNIFTPIILIINSALLLYILKFISEKHEKEVLINALTLAFMISLFSAGLFLHFEPLLLLLIGLITFLIIFFGNEYMFHSLFYTKEKEIKELKESEIPDDDIINKNKIVFSQEETKFGLSKEQIRELPNISEKINIRKIIPTSLIILFNFIVYILSSLAINQKNSEIIVYLLTFLFISFLAGGIIAIFMMLIYSIKNFKETKKLFSKNEKIGFLTLVLITIIFAIIFPILLYACLLGFMYFFVRGAKLLEKAMFIKKKPLEKITLGDWIEQDIKIGTKTYFSKDDFKLGIDEKQLEKIKELAKKHKELNELYIKDGIAFLPPLFIGFLILLII